jgi:hypothetical protein
MEIFAFYYFGSAFFGLLVLLPVWFLLCLFTPKILMDTYFKEPHFSLAETYMMRSFPGFWLRTGIFTWTIIMPWRSKNRKMDDIRSVAPKWFKVVACTTMAGMLVVLFNMVVLMPIALLF